MRPDWRRLTEHLRKSAPNRVVLSLDELEQTLGAPLISSARLRVFWSNARKGYAEYWLEADYLVSLAGLPSDQVAFNHDPNRAAVCRRVLANAASRQAVSGRPVLRGGTLDGGEAVALLIGCVATKAAGARPAKDLYASALFRGRRAYAEATGRPWVILSAKHGVVDPDEVLEPYEQRVADFRGAEREAWTASVVEGLDRRFGPLAGKAFEIHAGDEYVQAILPPLCRAGARLVRPLQGLGIGEQIRWYQGRAGGEELTTPTPLGGRAPRLAAQPGKGGRGLARQISEAFWGSRLDLSARAETPAQGAEALPEARAVRALRAAGASAVDVRPFLTLVAAMASRTHAGEIWRRSGP